MIAWIAQLVEHSPEEGGVSSSSLLPSTKEKTGRIATGLFLFLLMNDI
ncbi:MAG: hypothetical protein RL538_77 [Candidatus Parcubacteria bacterium]